MKHRFEGAATKDDLRDLEELDEKGVGLSDWEKGFLESCLRVVRELGLELSERQRKKVRELLEERVP